MHPWIAQQLVAQRAEEARRRARSHALHQGMTAPMAPVPGEPGGRRSVRAGVRLRVGRTLIGAGRRLAPAEDGRPATGAGARVSPRPC
ncbi:MAG: hypothetical protein ACRD0J_01155 [Acidimicrobiales bacterium]